MNLKQLLCCVLASITFSLSTAYHLSTNPPEFEYNNTDPTLHFHNFDVYPSFETLNHTGLDSFSNPHYLSFLAEKVKRRLLEMEDKKCHNSSSVIDKVVKDIDLIYDDIEKLIFEVIIPCQQDIIVFEDSSNAGEIFDDNNFVLNDNETIFDETFEPFEVLRIADEEKIYGINE